MRELPLDEPPSPSAVVDIDDERSWPARVATQVADWASCYGGTTEYPSDLPIPLEHEVHFRQLFLGYRLRAYHCTRLLPLETRHVREHGLALLTISLVTKRIDEAEAAGAITSQLASTLRQENALVKRDGSRREDQICFILSDDALRNDVSALGGLLTTWGGEAIFKPAYPQVRTSLAKLGTPTIVTALLEVADTSQRHTFYPSLHKVFVGVALGLRRGSGDIFYRSAVPAGSIERIAQPGDPSYDRFTRLPRA